MATLRIGTLNFHFHTSIEARKYDESEHYRKVVQLSGKRAVDITAVIIGNRPSRAWLIEVKDYRQLRGLPKDSLPGEIIGDFVRKVNETIEGLSDASVDAVDAVERSHAARMLTAKERRVVFHLEPYVGLHSRLFPDPTANVSQKLKQLFGSTSQVLNIKRTPKANVPWTVS